METNLKECEAGEKPLYKPGFLTVRDINGDGKPDYILNYEHFQCGERESMFCGTGGCQTDSSPPKRRRAMCRSGTSSRAR